VRIYVFAYRLSHRSLEPSRAKLTKINSLFLGKATLYLILPPRVLVGNELTVKHFHPLLIYFFNIALTLSFHRTQVVDENQGDLQRLNDQGQQARTSLLVLPYLLFLSQKQKENTCAS
jgi:hypothetical protein